MITGAHGVSPVPSWRGFVASSPSPGPLGSAARGCQRAIVAVFEKEAKAAQQKAKEHSQLKGVYAAQPDMQTMVSHCDMLVKQYQQIATELTAMAEMHKKMGKMGGIAQ
jgi:hypothetical protein